MGGTQAVAASSGEPTRVLLVEDHAVLRQLLAKEFDEEPGFRVVAQAGSVAQARALSGTAFDLAIVDLNLPDGRGLDVIRDLRSANAIGAVLVLTASADTADVARAVAAGASAVVHKSAELEEIVDAARRLAAGEALLAPREVIELLRRSDTLRDLERDAQEKLASLTAREREVLRALADGLGDAQIAERLTISAETAGTHVRRILAKLGVSSRLHAVIYAARHGAVQLS